jgi:hypothetical protein
MSFTFLSTKALGLDDVPDKGFQRILGTYVMGNPVLAIGTTTTACSTTAATEFCINGKVFTKAATADLFVHSDVTVQPVGTTRYYGLYLNASGTATVVQGDSTKLPAPADDVCLIGVIKVVTDATHTFTPGTTAHSAAGITATYTTLTCIPVGGISVI